MSYRLSEILLAALAMVLVGTSLGLARNQLRPALALGATYQPALPAQAELVDLPTAYALFHRQEALFLDARESERYRAGHVPGAVNLQADSMESLDPRLLDRLLVIYCDGLECGASARLAERILRERGNRGVLILSEGYPGWSQAGYPVMTSGGS